MDSSFSPNFEEYFLQNKLSDVVLVVKDESDESSAQERRLPGHSMVLVAFSKYCKAKLDNWSPSNSASSCQATQLEVQLPVPAGQQELAELLVKGMHQAQPSITDGLNHWQLLQLIILADRFEVPKAMTAAAAAVAEVAADKLDWDTALQLLQLPLSYAQQPDSGRLNDLAVQCLQERLGDLEEVWAVEQLQQLLLHLPHAALVQLLQHDDTCVAVENTVVYTIERWYAAQPAGQCSDDELRQLMYLVRVQHCTPYYAATVMSQSSLVQKGFDAFEVGLLQLCCLPTSYEQLLKANCAAMSTYPAWRKQRRPVSTTPPVIDLRVPLSAVETAVQQLLRNGSATTAAHTDVIVQGQRMNLSAVLAFADNGCGLGFSAQAQSAVGVFGQLQLQLKVSLVDMPHNAVRIMSGSVSVVYADKIPGVRCYQSRFESTSVPVSQGRSECITGVMPLGAACCWQEVEEALRQQGLVHEKSILFGQCSVHVRAELTQLL